MNLKGVLSMRIAVRLLTGDLECSALLQPLQSPSERASVELDPPPRDSLSLCPKAWDLQNKDASLNP